MNYFELDDIDLTKRALPVDAGSTLHQASAVRHRSGKSSKRTPWKEAILITIQETSILLLPWHPFPIFYPQ